MYTNCSQCVYIFLFVRYNGTSEGEKYEKIIGVYVISMLFLGNRSINHIAETAKQIYNIKY